MPRPRKCRRVCCLPESSLFGPLEREGKDLPDVVMSVEEFETVRLIDLNELTQEECAVQMSVARATVQRIYNEARKKLAEMLVNGAPLRIEGGDYLLCQDPGGFPCRGCRRNCPRAK